MSNKLPKWDVRDYRLASDIRVLPSYGLLPNDDRMISMNAVLLLLEEHAAERGDGGMTLDETVSKMLKQSGGRGLTCHEIAAELHQEPKAIGRSLARLADNLDHMNSERDGQKVILWAGREHTGNE